MNTIFYILLYKISSFIIYTLSRWYCIAYDYSIATKSQCENEISFFPIHTSH